MKLNNSHILAFNLDYIEIYGHFKNVDMIREGLDWDNSNISTFWDFVCMYSDAQNYKYKITFLHNNIPCFAYYEGVQVSERITTKNYFIVYGKAFHLFSLEQIFGFIEKNLVIEHIRRFDLALDTSLYIEELLRYFKDLKQKGARIYGDGGRIETYYIGEKQNRFNRSLLIRIYDKIADIQAKWLQKIYPEYSQEKTVTRFELEFRPELCRNLSFEQLQDKDYLFRLFITYIEKHTLLFKNLGKEPVQKLVRPKKKLDTKKKAYWYSIPERYLTAFMGYGKNIMKLGGCPVDILLRNDIVRLSTIQNLNKTLKKGRISVLSYKFGIEGEDIPELYRRPEYQIPLYKNYEPVEDLDIPF